MVDEMATVLRQYLSADTPLKRAKAHKNAHAILKQYDDGDHIALVWSVEDVLSDEVRPDLTKEQARDVLDSVKRHHDCNDGVSWETLRYAADHLFPEQEPAKPEIRAEDLPF